MTDAVSASLVEPDGRIHAVEARAGTTLMRAATDAGVDSIKADCGGLMSCATCHVIVADEWVARLPAPVDEELSMLEMTAAPREPASRLACQIVLQPDLAGLVVRLPDTQY